jgi:hypothetical protein
MSHCMRFYRNRQLRPHIHAGQRRGVHLGLSDHLVKLSDGPAKDEVSQCRQENFFLQPNRANALRRSVMRLQATTTNIGIHTTAWRGRPCATIVDTMTCATHVESGRAWPKRLVGNRTGDRPWAGWWRDDLSDVTGVQVENLKNMLIRDT